MEKQISTKNWNLKLNKILKSLIPLNDDVFMLFARNKDFCQEFLRIVLQNDKIVVLENDIQKILPSIANKISILDMICKLGDGSIANVEIQLAREKAHAKRILTYASKIRAGSIEKGSKYKDIKNIIIIYLTLEDIFKLGSTVYEVQMNIVSDRDIVVGKWDAGLQVYYVNTKGLTNKNINEYLKLLTDRTTFSQKYKITNEIKRYIYKGEEAQMSSEMRELLEEIKQEGRQEGRLEGIEKGIEKGRAEERINLLVSLVNDKIISIKEASSRLGMTENNFAKLMSN